uniref:Uncharacterized protein n=1 Tax=Opuntia streptacantha TaxID=393608 RepID=A0A7C9F380_OPUST
MLKYKLPSFPSITSSANLSFEPLTWDNIFVTPSSLTLSKPSTGSQTTRSPEVVVVSPSKVVLFTHFQFSNVPFFSNLLIHPSLVAVNNLPSLSTLTSSGFFKMPSPIFVTSSNAEANRRIAPRIPTIK